MATTREKFSERQAGYKVAVDVLALSPQARARGIPVPVMPNPVVVQNTTKVWAYPVGVKCKVLGASVVFSTVPAVSGGTCTLKIDYVASDGTTTTNIVAATSILSLTNLVPLTLTLAATNPSSNAVGGSFVFTVVTSNNAVGTADVGGMVSLALENVEDTVISDTNSTI